MIDETLKSFLVLSEAIEMPLIADFLYRECQKHNIKYATRKHTPLNSISSVALPSS